LFGTAQGYIPGFRDTVKYLAKPAALAVTASVGPSMVPAVASCAFATTMNDLSSTLSNVKDTAHMINNNVLPLVENAVTALPAIASNTESFTSAGSDLMSIAKTVAETALRPFTGSFYKEIFSKVTSVITEFFRAWLDFRPMTVATSLH